MSDSTLFFSWEMQEKCHRCRFYIRKIICCIHYQGDIQYLSPPIWDVIVELCAGSWAVSSVDPPWSCSRVFQWTGRSFMASCAWVCYCPTATEWRFLLVSCLSACLAGALLKNLPSTTIWLPWNITGIGTARKMLNSVLSFQTTSMNWWPSNLQR